LDLDAEEGLENAVVEVARNAAALASMARARKCLKRKMFSRAGPMCIAMRSSQARSSFWNGLRPFIRNSRPVACPPCSKRDSHK